MRATPPLCVPGQRHSTPAYPSHRTPALDLLNANPHPFHDTLRPFRQVRRDLGRQARRKRLHAARRRVQRVRHERLDDAPGVGVALHVLRARAQGP